jgi:hypothetical protein
MDRGDAKTRLGQWDDEAVGPAIWRLAMVESAKTRGNVEGFAGDY